MTEATINIERILGMARRTGTREEMEAELADVIVSAFVAAVRRSSRHRVGEAGHAMSGRTRFDSKQAEAWDFLSQSSIKGVDPAVGKSRATALGPHLTLVMLSLAWLHDAGFEWPGVAQVAQRSGYRSGMARIHLNTLRDLRWVDSRETWTRTRTDVPHHIIVGWKLDLYVEES